MTSFSSVPQHEPYVRPGQTINDFLQRFWQRQINVAETELIDHRHPPLPLARIKKVMKNDPDVKMIAADAPILLCKACEILIEEMTCRAYIVADSNKRRTVSRSDVAKGIARCDQFDFLIDVVPRDDYAAAASSVPRNDPSGAQPPQPPQDSHLEEDTDQNLLSNPTDGSLPSKLPISPQDVMSELTQLDSLLNPSALQEPL